MRPFSALLQRGFDNAVANWPLVLIGIAAQVAMIVLFVFLFVLMLIPGVMMGISLDVSDFGGDPASFIEEFLLAHPFFVIYVFFAIGLVLIPVMIVYSFVEGAKYGILLTGERARGDGGWRAAMRVFEPGLWMRWGRETWWRTFWVYNIVWAVAFGLLLAFFIVFAAIAVMLALSGGNAGSAVAVGCFALLIVVPLILVIMVVTNMVAQTAMSLLVRDGEGAVATLGAAMSFIRLHPARAIGVTVVTLLVAFAVGGAFGGVGMVVQLGGELDESLLVMMLPIQIIFTVVQTAVSIAVQTWMSAVFVSMIQDRAVARTKLVAESSGSAPVP